MATVLTLALIWSVLALKMSPNRKPQIKMKYGLFWGHINCNVHACRIPQTDVPSFTAYSPDIGSKIGKPFLENEICCVI